MEINLKEMADVKENCDVNVKIMYWYFFFRRSI